MNVNYAAIKTAMTAAGYKASEGEGWTPADVAEFRTFSHFVLGIDHSRAHLVTTYPQVFQAQLDAAGIDALGTGEVVDPDEDGGDAVPVAFDAEPDAFSTYQKIDELEGQRATPAPEPELSFTVTGAKAADSKESAAAPVENASEPAATASKLVGEGESTVAGAEPAQIADSATVAKTQLEDETADDLEQAQHDEGAGEGDSADEDEDSDEDDTPPADADDDNIDLA